MAYFDTEDKQHDAVKLKAAIIAKSVAKDWETARKEWVYDRSEQSPVRTHCPCGHSITEMCFIRNRVNGNSLFLGNVCINKIDLFSEQQLELINSEKVIRDKLAKKITATIPVVMVVHLLNNSQITYNEYDVYTAKIHKRRLYGETLETRLAVNFKALRNIYKIKSEDTAKVLDDLERFAVVYHSHWESYLGEAYFDILRNGFGDLLTDKTLETVKDVNEHFEKQHAAAEQLRSALYAQAQQRLKEQAEREELAKTRFQQLVDQARQRNHQPAPAPTMPEYRPAPTLSNRFSICQALLLQKLNNNEKAAVKLFMTGEGSAKTVRKLAKRFGLSGEF